MKIKSILYPDFINYYVSAKIISHVNVSLLEGKCQIDNNRLHVYAPNKEDSVFDALRTIKQKSEKTTIGNKYVYEYELDTTSPNENTFIITLDDGTKYRCVLIHVGVNETNHIHLIFKFI